MLNLIGEGRFHSRNSFTALSKQKQFENSGLADTDSQQSKAVDAETRQRAIAIVKKLLEAVLDEAVKFLESLYVKGEPVE
ncbi:hypothetical protein QUA42_15150 [Microcoleus sp. Pol11C2]|uniref:hypothetical protein n=1 Tax=Microcoleus sp. Pol11C2 TaxID=3055389 RepID=UPI002FD01275